MVMISHNDIGMDPPPISLRRLRQRGNKRFCRALGFKHILPIISSIDYVIERSRIFDPQASWHNFRPASSTTQHKSRNDKTRPDPFGSSTPSAHLKSGSHTLD